MMTIFVYSNETGELVASHTEADNAACEAWALQTYSDCDYHWSYCDTPVSDAVESE